jgi:hypothetical protein
LNYFSSLIEKNVKWIEKWGNKVGEIQRAHGVIYYLPGGVYEINGKTILVIPGATSHDKHARIENIDWWSNETLSRDETEKILDDLDKVNWKVDFILSHTPGSGVQHHFFEGYPRHDSVAQFIDFIQERLEFKYSFFGHMHNDRLFIDEIDGIKEYHQCAYNNIIDICQYKTIRKLEEEEEEDAKR